MKTPNRVNCDTCGKLFNKPKCWVKRSKNNYCSINCHNIEQAKNKASIICKICGNLYSLPKCYILDRIRYSTCDNKECRIANKRKSNNPNWKGGVTTLNKRLRTSEFVKKWARQIKIRDNYTCQLCGLYGSDINSDHYPIPFAGILKIEKITNLERAKKSKHLNDLENGRTLCVACHKHVSATASKIMAMNNRIWQGKEDPPILCDFDGVLAENAWSDGVEVIGEPMWKNINAIRNAAKKNKIIIYSARPPRQEAIVAKWLKKHKIPFDDIFLTKPIAGIYIDDRAIPPETFIKNHANKTA